MMQDEYKKFESPQSDFSKYWIPCVWCTNLVVHARWDGHIHDGHICDNMALCLLMDASLRRVCGGPGADRRLVQSLGSPVLVLSAQELNLHQAECSMSLCYECISIPLRSLSKTGSHARKQGCTLSLHPCPSVHLLHTAGSAPKGH